MKPKAILLDLGGVVFSLQWHKTIQRLGIPPENTKLILNEIQTWPPYDKLERGQITFEEFQTEVENRQGQKWESSFFLSAWEEVLGDYVPGVRAFLEDLSKKIPLFALTNTSETHYRKMQRQFDPKFFRRIFTSFELGCRKPEKEIFETTCKEMGFAPSNVLFIDDSPIHVKGAQTAGLVSHHLPPQQNLPELLKKIGITP